MSAAEPSSPTESTPRPRFQFSLRMVLLLMAAIGVWTTAIVNWRMNASLTKRIAALKPLARELDIEDPNKIAVVKCEELWYDENQWDVYLPNDEYQLVLASREVPNIGTPPSSATARLPAGRYRLSLTQDKTPQGFAIQVTRDSQPFLQLDEEPGWDPGNGSSGGGQFTISEQFKPSENVVLFRRQFSIPASSQGGGTSYRTPDGPSNGLMLWIEPAPPAASKPLAP